MEVITVNGFVVIRVNSMDYIVAIRDKTTGHIETYKFKDVWAGKEFLEKMVADSKDLEYMILKGDSNVKD